MWSPHPSAQAHSADDDDSSVSPVSPREKRDRGIDVVSAFDTESTRQPAAGNGSEPSSEYPRGPSPFGVTPVQPPRFPAAASGRAPSPFRTDESTTDDPPYRQPHDGLAAEAVVHITNFAGHQLLPLVYRTDVGPKGLGVYVGGSLLHVATTLLVDFDKGVLQDQEGVGGCLRKGSEDVLFNLRELASARAVHHNLQLLEEVVAPRRQRRQASASRSRSRGREERQAAFEKLYADAAVNRSTQAMIRRKQHALHSNTEKCLMGYRDNRVRIDLPHDVNRNLKDELLQYVKAVVSEAGLPWTRRRRDRAVVLYGTDFPMHPSRNGTITPNLSLGCRQQDRSSNFLIDFDDGTSEYWPQELLTFFGSSPPKVTEDTYSRLSHAPKHEQPERNPMKLRDHIDRIHDGQNKYDVTGSTPTRMTACLVIRKELVKEVQDQKEASYRKPRSNSLSGSTSARRSASGGGTRVRRAAPREPKDRNESSVKDGTMNTTQYTASPLGRSKITLDDILASTGMDVTDHESEPEEDPTPKPPSAPATPHSGSAASGAATPPLSPS